MSDATFTQSDGRYVLAVERHFDHPPAKVWRLLTERALLRQWFPCDVEGDWVVGAPLRFHFSNGEGDGLSEHELTGEVLTVVPQELLLFRWGDHHLRCELVPAASGCTLLFSETLDDPTMGARNAVGWEMCFDALQMVIEGAGVAKFVYEVWQGKFKHYVAKFQPTMGPQAGIPESHPEHRPDPPG